MKFFLTTLIISLLAWVNGFAQPGESSPTHDRLWQVRQYIQQADSLVDTEMQESLRLSLLADSLSKTITLPAKDQLDLWRVKAGGYVRTGQLNKSLECYHLNLALRDSLGLTEGLGLVYRNLGGISSFQRKMDDALYYTNLALECEDTRQDSNLLASVHLYIGVMYYQLLDNETSIEHIMQSLTISRKLNSKSLIGSNLVQLANLMRRAEAWPEVHGYLHEAKAYLQDPADQKTLSMVYHNLALGFLDEEIYDSAYFYVEKAKGVWLAIEDYGTLVRGLNTEARIMQHQGNLERAIAVMQQALKYAEETDDKVLLTETYRSLAIYAMESKQYIAGRDWGKKSYDLALEINSPFYLFQSSQLLGDAYQKTGDYEKAANMLQLALNNKDSLEAERSTQEMLRREALYSFNQKTAEISQLKMENDLKSVEADLASQKAQSASLIRNVVVIGAVLLILALIVLFRSRQQRHRAHFKQRVSELEMKAIQAQMNPHFMYNALGSIQGLINNDDKHAANLYLSKFATLLRKVLEFSERKSVALNEELEALEIYVELEQLRFAFDYEFQIDQEVDTYQVEIPSLLFQPFIENAVHHGLRHKKNKGKLTLKVEAGAEELVCVVEDNGVGRAAAADAPPVEHYKGKSYGTELTEERLRILDQKHRSSQIVIEDIETENQQAAGTRVTFRIPFEN